MNITIAGVDLAWKSENNPSAIAFGHIIDSTLAVSGVDFGVYVIDSIFDRLSDIKGLRGVAIDASLIINNISGQREEMGSSPDKPRSNPLHSALGCI